MRLFLNRKSGRPGRWTIPVLNREPAVVLLAVAAFTASAIGAAWLHAKPLQAPAQDYLVYAVCESADRIARLRFGPAGGKLERALRTGNMPADINGPHGLAFSPDKQSYYVSIGHGRPFGSVWKYAAKDDAVLGQVTLGFFPATEDVTPDGNFLYVVNFNLHGDMVPSSVSVVSTDDMTEIARIPTCIMPHGSRINPQGTSQYSACMMDDMVVEIDTRALKVSRYFRLSKGKEMGMQGSPQAVSGHMAMKPEDVTCSPTWAQPSADGAFVYAACNKSSEIVEIDAKTWTMTRRIPAGPGVYNLAVTKDGRLLIATNKRGQSASVFDRKTGKELARIPTKRKVVHGAVVSPDNKYAFISVEGIGSEPGTVEMIDLEALKTVATVDTPPQAAGIDFYKTEPAQP